VSIYRTAAEREAAPSTTPPRASIWRRIAWVLWRRRQVEERRAYLRDCRQERRDMQALLNAIASSAARFSSSTTKAAPARHRRR